MGDLPHETRADGVEVAQGISDVPVAHDLKERLISECRNRGVPQMEARGDGVLAKVNQRGIDPKEGQQSKLDYRIIGLASKQPERGAQGAFQLANAEAEELTEPQG